MPFPLQLGRREAQKFFRFSPLYWPKMPYILTFSMSLVFKNVLFFQELSLLLNSVCILLIKMCVGVYINCLIGHLVFCFEFM